MEDTLMTIAQAARLKNCTRQTVYRMIKERKFNTKEVAERPFVVNDAQFRSMPIKHKVAPSLLKELQAQVQEVLERVTKLEKENKELRASLDALQRKKDKRETSKYKEKSQGWSPPLALGESI